MAHREKSVVFEGLALGFVLLAVMIAFAVGLTRWHSKAALGEVTLPQTLSGGYAIYPAADAQFAPSVASATATFKAGTAMAEYVQGQNAVLVQATRLPGEAALFPGTDNYSEVDNAVCWGGGSSGSSAICRRTDNDLTVQVTAADTATAAKYANEVYTQIATKRF